MTNIAPSFGANASFEASSTLAATSIPGPYKYDVRVDAPGDPLPQNNRAMGFAIVRGEPRILIVSADPEQDRQLATALQSSRQDAE